jgi:hypothetical protein
MRRHPRSESPRPLRLFFSRVWSVPIGSATWRPSFGQRCSGLRMGALLFLSRWASLYRVSRRWAPGSHVCRCFFCTKGPTTLLAFVGVLHRRHPRGCVLQFSSEVVMNVTRRHPCVWPLRNRVRQGPFRIPVLKETAFNNRCDS